MPNLAVIDAGPLIALFNKNDIYHQQVRGKIVSFKENRGHLLTTWPAITEATQVLDKGFSPEASFDLLHWISLRGMETFHLTTDHIHRIITLQKKYRDHSMDFADASLLIAAEDNNTRQVFSIDFRDFRTYRIFKNQTIENLINEID